jgi:ubiquinone/menaquinone biosynthesis C-methylase UbiE
MFDDHYVEWREKRINAIVDHYGLDFLRGKTMLEVGCGYGDIGGFFAAEEVEVTCSDAREEYLIECAERYPDVKTIVADLDKEWPPGTYDIVLHLGVLYHLADYKQTIRDACRCCTHLVLETEVLNSSELTTLPLEESGYDQAFNGVGNRPTQAAVEKILDDCGFIYEMVVDDRCNSGFHSYDWEIDESKEWHHGLRRFWFCKKVA